MKKKYIIPTLGITRINVENMIAASTSETPAVVGDNGELNNEVKRSNYDVWDDDWSR